MPSGAEHQKLGLKRIDLIAIAVNRKFQLLRAENNTFLEVMKITIGPGTPRPSSSAGETTSRKLESHFRHNFRII
jgi:hypothetical protein